MGEAWSPWLRSHFRHAPLAEASALGQTPALVALNHLFAASKSGGVADYYDDSLIAST
jgi:hypothetical protein